MHEPVSGLSERLLRSGVAPRRVRRYAAELRDHFEDLTAEAIASGIAPAEARRTARQRLGDVEALAGAMLETAGMRSFSHRFPAVAFLLAPMLVQAAIPALLAALVVAAGRGPMLGQVGTAAEALLIVSPLLVGWVIATHAVSHRSRLPWPLAGIVVTLALGTALQFDLTMPSPGGPGAIAVGLALPEISRLAVATSLTIAPLLVARVQLRPL